MQRTNPVKTGSSKLIIGLLATLLCVVVVAAGVIIFQLSQRESSEKEEETKLKKDLLITEENISSIKEELEQTENDTVPASYDVMMNSDWYFEDGKSKSSNASVTNYKTNKNTVYFDVILNDSGEVVYSSPYISVGAVNKQFALDKELPAGNYEAVCKYYILDEEMNTLCTVSVNITLHIKK